MSSPVSDLTGSVSRTPTSLLARLRHGPRSDDWPRFVDLYTPLMFKWARSWGLDEAAAADLVQGTFVIVLRKMPSYQYDPNRTFRGWLWTVLHRLFLAEKRKARSVHAADGVLEQVESPSYPDDASDLRELIVRRYRSIRGDFNEATAIIFEQCVFEGRDRKEVAREVGATPGAVTTAICRVRQRLREELQEELGGLLGSPSSGSTPS